jgi:hypothetical protein
VVKGRRSLARVWIRESAWAAVVLLVGVVFEVLLVETDLCWDAESSTNWWWSRAGEAALEEFDCAAPRRVRMACIVVDRVRFGFFGIVKVV